MGDLAFASLSAGFGRTCGLTADGTVYCWGSIEWGFADETPRQWSDVAFRTVRVGPAVSFDGCGISTAGEAYCGFNDPGFDRFELELELVDIHGAGLHHCAAATDGTVYCWGQRARGALGDGTTIWVAEPQRVIGF